MQQSTFLSQVIKVSFLALFALLLTEKETLAQVDTSSELYRSLAQKDSLLFVEGFNKCHIEKFEGLLAPDLEFYHNTGGMQNREEFFEAFSNNICSGSPIKPIRTLVPGTLEVFPLNKNGELYGAIQKGEHEFYIRRDEVELEKTGVAKFTHIWLLEDEKWVIKRVLSYDHQGVD
ncbi:nuclear transport factor 2 family protein [Gracilimonas sp.]|uniref:nuclear transport factor 2 family protein n=1 Tax=Gracilimonas sp. TaxID=1974203 RepID=UPI0028712A7A|nr:nuclear transport factor 2 family protein [Gracilimonas sp.]